MLEDLFDILNIITSKVADADSPAKEQVVLDELEELQIHANAQLSSKSYLTSLESENLAAFLRALFQIRERLKIRFALQTSGKVI